MNATDLERRLAELDAAILVERELEAWRLHRRLRALGIQVDVDALRPLAAPPPRREDKRPRTLVRDFGTILRVR